MVDCEYEMGGPDAPVCAWAPGSCKSWCRSNATKWAHEVIDIMDEVVDGSFLGFGVHIDMLDPCMLRHIISGASLDDHVAEMHTETMEALGISGVFGSGHVMRETRGDLERGVSCNVWVAGLVKSIARDEEKWQEPPRHVVDMWEAWDWSTNPAGPVQGTAGMDGWSLGSVVISRDPKIRGRYFLTKGALPAIMRPKTGVVGAMAAAQRECSRDEAIDAVARTVGDDMSSLRMARSKIFYDFGCRTVRWPFGRAKGFAAMLRLMAKNGLLRASTNGAFESVWTFPTMGPRTSCRTGNIHVSLNRAPPAGKEIAWGSSVSTQIAISGDPRSEDTCIVKINVLTSW